MPYSPSLSPSLPSPLPSSPLLPAPSFFALPPPSPALSFPIFQVSIQNIQSTEIDQLQYVSDQMVTLFGNDSSLSSVTISTRIDIQVSKDVERSVLTSALASDICWQTYSLCQIIEVIQQYRKRILQNAVYYYDIIIRDSSFVSLNINSGLISDIVESQILITYSNYSIDYRISKNSIESSFEFDRVNTEVQNLIMNTVNISSDAILVKRPQSSIMKSSTRNDPYIIISITIIMLGILMVSMSYDLYTPKYVIALKDEVSEEFRNIRIEIHIPKIFQWLST